MGSLATGSIDRTHGYASSMRGAGTRLCASCLISESKILIVHLKYSARITFVKLCLKHGEQCCSQKWCINLLVLATAIQRFRCAICPGRAVTRQVLNPA